MLLEQMLTKNDKTIYTLKEVYGNLKTSVSTYSLDLIKI